MRRYVSKSGTYPTVIRVRVRDRSVRLQLFHPADLDTTNQVFCRNDYPVEPSDRVFVDLGANIGLVTRYFCEVSDDARVFSFEPLPENIRKFKLNTEPVVARVELREAAVADFSGIATFVTEPVGRYCHLGDASDGATTHISVRVVHAADAIDQILEKTNEIDVLKVDIEGTEEAVLRALRPDQLRRIGKIFAEYSGSFTVSRNPLGFRHSFHSHSWSFRPTLT